jgi:hypothetical protein
MRDVFTHIRGVKGRWEPRRDPFKEKFDPFHKMFISVFYRLSKWIVVTELNKNFPCHVCRNSERDEPDFDCVHCLGTGYQWTARKVRVTTAPDPDREMMYSRTQRLFYGLFEVGIVDPSTRLYVTLPQDRLDLWSLVFEVQWSCPSEKVNSEGVVVSIDSVFRVIDSRETLYKGKLMFNSYFAAMEDFELSDLNSKVDTLFSGMRQERAPWIPVLFGEI